MFKNFIVTTFRSMKRQRVYSMINIIGLSTGVMSFLLIVMYVTDAVSYEKFYPNVDEIYRFTTEYKTQEGTNELAILPARALEIAYQNIPEAEHITLLSGARSSADILVEVGGNKFVETNHYLADTSYFKVFQHRFIQGDPNSALSSPSSVVITQSTADKYFGAFDVVGEGLRINGEEHIITGIIEDFQGNSVLNFDLLLPSAGKNWINTSGWYPMRYEVFGRFNSSEQAQVFDQKLDKLVAEDTGFSMANDGFTMNFNLEPIAEMLFNTTAASDFSKKLPKKMVYALIVLSVFILVIACINYVNLSTAKSEKRSKEVGVRKVLGANRNQLKWQFYGETFITTLIAVVLGLVLTEIVIGPFNGMLGTDLSLQAFEIMPLAIGLVGLTLIISIISGLYPANFLSSFSPVKSLRGGTIKAGGNVFRKVLVGFQFVVSVFLIVGTVTLSKQMLFIKNKATGYEKEQLVYFKLSDQNSKKAYDVIKREIGQIPGVEAVSGSSDLISNVVTGWGATMEANEDLVTVLGQTADEEFLETMGFELLAGQSFKNISDLRTSYSYLMNETAAKAFGVSAQEAVGRDFQIGQNRLGKVIGVVKDFHSNSIHTKIEPWVAYAGPDKTMNYLFAKVSMDRFEQIESQMASVWNESIETFPFEVLFVEESVKEAYDEDKKLGRIIMSFTTLAIIIGCLGLFGLASYLIEKRTKEIGIRKVLGARVLSIVALLSRDFAWIIIVSNLIAWPIGYYVMDQWLQSFAYRIDMNWTVFFLSSLLTLLIAGLSISFQSVKAAFANPINALRNE